MQQSRDTRSTKEDRKQKVGGTEEDRIGGSRLEKKEDEKSLLRDRIEISAHFRGSLATYRESRLKILGFYLRKRCHSGT